MSLRLRRSNLGHDDNKLVCIHVVLLNLENVSKHIISESIIAHLTDSDEVYKISDAQTFI